MHQGYIRLFRQLQDNELWLSERFTRGQAWVDMIMLANHKTGYIRKRGILIKIERGQLGHGENFLAERWKWSRGKVRRFLAELTKNRQMVRRTVQTTGQKKTSVSVCIEIINYDKYQPSGTDNGTSDGQKTDRRRTEDGTGTRNEKNDKNDNKRFMKPKVQEISDYCNERNNGIDPQYFWDTNEGKGWKVGKTQTPMKDWKAVVRTWEKNNYGDKSKTATEKTADAAAEWLSGKSNINKPDHVDIDAEFAVEDDAAYQEN